MISLLFALKLAIPTAPVAPVPVMPTDGLPSKAPVSVGMSAERLAAIDRVVSRGLRAGGYPGAAVVVGRKGAAVWKKGFGRLDWDSSSEAVAPDESIYDLASLTKVIGTTTALMVLFDEGTIRLDDPVVKYVPGASRTRRKRRGRW
ncbi:MAG: serine hydrolase [Gemmatimonadaceae bacterium]|nr:serine hydrolase [Gemmatimonadaceae bacterium]